MSKLTYVFFVFLMLTACEDPFLRARRIIETDPKNAIELLKEAEKSKKGCDQCPLYMAMAYENMNNKSAAEKLLESVAKSGNSRIENQAVKELYKLYRSAFIKASKVKAISVAKKAQGIEKRLKIADGFAGKFLMNYYKKQFKKELKNNKPKKAVQSIKKVLATFTAPSGKKAFIKDANRALKSYFTRQFIARIPRINTALSKTEYFDTKTSEIVLSNKFIVPSKAENPMFDPERKDFPLRVRVKACEPLHSQLMTVVKVFYDQSPIKLKPLDKKSTARLFQLVFPVASAGYDVIHPDNKSKAGLPYLCFIRIKPSDFVNYLYSLWAL